MNFTRDAWTAPNHKAFITFLVHLELGKSTGKGNLCRSQVGVCAGMGMGPCTVHPVCAGMGMGSHTVHPLPVPVPMHRFSHRYLHTLHIVITGLQVCTHLHLFTLTLSQTLPFAHTHVCHGWDDNNTR